MASNDKITAVPNTLGKEIGLSATWLNTHEFATFAFGNVKHSRDAKLNTRQGVVEVNLMKPDFVLGDPAARIMMHECHRVFYNLQRRRYGLLGGQTQVIDFVGISHQYRSSLRQSVGRLTRLLHDEEKAPGVNTDLLRLLYTIECVWHLVEFLVLDSNASSGAVVTSLLEWIRYHFPTPEQQATELLQSGTRDLEKQEDYWPVVKGLILQGQTMVARTLLRVHSCSETRCFQAAEQLLQSLPVYCVHDGLSVHKYKAQWQCWRNNVRMLIAAGNFGAEPHLEEVLRLVSGDREAWQNQLRQATCWYEYLPGFLLYTDSSCRYYQLSHYAHNCMRDYFEVTGRSREDPEFTFLDAMVLSVMDNDLPTLLANLQKFPDNHFSAVHITDLLYHAGLLEDSATGDGDDGEARSGGTAMPHGKLIHESLLYEFGSLLMSEGTYWLLGMGYLEFSSTEGLGAREALLARVPIRHEAQALKLIAVARKHNYPGVVMEICKVLMKRNLAQRRYGSALNWAIRSRDSAYVRDVANILLEHYCNHGELLCEKMIANLGSKMFLSSRLVFLKKYYDFRQLYRQLEYAQAAELLVSLMDSKIVPSYFWPCLMADVIPLLEFKEPIIPSRETLIVLDHLQMDLVPMLEQRQETLKRQKQQQDPGTVAKSLLGLTAAANAPRPDPMETEEQDQKDQTALIPKFSSNLLNNCTEDLINLLRLACNRNLSRAYIIEHTSGD
uniref:Nuclear pore complex protein Nup85 n=1 Tax=Anopheles atroparvus TaxID=41427 RepID=A0AAG5DIP2_ANOAO